MRPCSPPPLWSGPAPPAPRACPPAAASSRAGVAIGTPRNGGLTITQSSQTAIVNWQGFSIGQGNRVEIRQPDSRAAILNRVTGQTTSTIAGQLDANGQVYLVNPNGITITRTGQVHAAASSGKPVNIKKGQFLAPGDMTNVADKARDAAIAAGGDGHNIMVCERGVSFGYNNLVSDMRSLAIMRETRCPVVFDATHSVQLPGGQGATSGGQREFVPVLARAALAVGVSGVFMETHPDPANAMSDGPNAVPLKHMRRLLETLVAIDRLVKAQGFAENDFGL